MMAPPGDRRLHRQRGTLHAGDRRHAGQGLTEERVAPRGLQSRLPFDSGHEDVRRVEADIGVHGVIEAADEQAGADEQYHRERGLRHHLGAATG